MKVLVTGGNGFIGSHLVRRLLKEEHSTTVIDYKPFSTAETGLEKASLLQLGAEDPKCERLFADNLFDVVVHLAYRTPETDNAEADSNLLLTNQVSLANILHLSYKHHVRKVIVFSSYEVYGQQDHHPISEDAELHPCTPVGHHQKTREQLCDEYRNRGLNVTVLRTGCVYGPGQTDCYDLFFQLLPDAALSFRPIWQYGPEGPVLDYIYVGDVVEAVILSMVRQSSQTLNVSNGRGVTSLDIRKSCQRYIDNAGSGSVADEDQDVGVTPGVLSASQIRIVDEPSSAHAEDMQTGLEHTTLRYILDNSRIKVELNWQPKYSIVQGMEKTLAWHARKRPVKKNSIATKRKHRDNRNFWKKESLLFAEVVVFSGIAIALTYLLQYRLNLRIDTLLLYIVLICLFYGLRQGMVAVVLSAAARIYLQLTMEKEPLVLQAIDTNVVLQIVVYLVLGLCISYTMDDRKHQIKNLRLELDTASQELGFVNSLYQKSLEIKNNLQFAIENNTNSLGKLIYLISRLERVELSAAYSEIAQIYSDVLRVSHVHVFHSDSSGQWFRMVASVGEVKYGKSIQASTYTFLDDVIRGQRIYINREMVKDFPQVCAPIFLDNELEAVVFIDGIEFINLTQYFINTLKSLTVLVSESMVRKHSHEHLVPNDKYYNNTVILKKDWFEKSIQARLDSPNRHILLLRINNEIFNYRSFNRVINNLIRSVDSVGELSEGRLGILLIDADEKFLPIIQSRFRDKGFSVDLVEIEQQAEVKTI